MSYDINLFYTLYNANLVNVGTIASPSYQVASSGSKRKIEEGANALKCDLLNALRGGDLSHSSRPQIVKKYDEFDIHTTKSTSKLTKAHIKVGGTHPLVHQIKTFCTLVHGWDTYDAEPPNSSAIYYAEDILSSSVLADFVPDSVAPSVEGGIVLLWKKNKKANIEIFNSGEILAAIRDRNGEPEIWDVRVENIERDLEKIREYVNS